MAPFRSYSQQIVKSSVSVRPATRQTPHSPLFFRKATPTVRGGIPKAESHFWLINTCPSFAIVKPTEIGKTSCLQFQTTKKTSKTGKKPKSRDRKTKRRNSS